MRVIFLGPPGVGKGTQAKRLSLLYQIPHLATGDILRAAISKGEAIGLEAKAYVHSGRLVPDELVIRIVKERLLEGDIDSGFILDGFPRTQEQADALSKMGDDRRIDSVLYFDLTEAELVKRLTGRQICEKCHEIYHAVNRPSHQKGICDQCGATLIVRKDDQPDAVVERLRAYKAETLPLVQYYEHQGCLSRINAGGSMEEVSRLIEQAIKRRNPSP